MWICVTALMGMMVLTAFDVFGRYFLNRPIRGALELTEFLLVIAVSAGFAYTQTTNGHISVELFVMRLPEMLELPESASISHSGISTVGNPDSRATSFKNS